uniref:Farnesyl pyrophosphate synthase n=1 Tax=Triticum urartu TaxID=4572 RepID=A0A8R7TW90_TRIUA
MAAAAAALSNGSGGDSKAEFAEIYSRLKEEMLEDPAFEFTDESLQWIDRMLDYNVLGGKCNRGLSVIDSYKTLKGVDVLRKEETFLACTLGWCIEWLQAYFLVLDDIMDNSQTRRGQPCWFRVPQVGLIAVNDGIILRNHISRILQRHFRGKPYYVDLIDLFNEVTISSDMYIHTKHIFCFLQLPEALISMSRLNSRQLQGSCWILSLLTREKRISQNIT